MPGARTEITEIVTALGTLAPDLPTAMGSRPDRLQNVSDAVWNQVVLVYEGAAHSALFETAFANGEAFLHADDGLRGRTPKLVEWKGPHRPPGDDVIPADIRIDHVFQVSCKYLSKILQNPGPARLFDRLLTGEQRTSADWFGIVAPNEYQAFYSAARAHVGGALPANFGELSSSQRAVLKEGLRERMLPEDLRPSWTALCAAVAAESSSRWSANLATTTARLRFFWRLLRIGDAPYYILGATNSSHIRLRVASAWDWTQAYELLSLTVSPRSSGQPEVSWLGVVRERATAAEVEVAGHVEIRWSHGRFRGSPEAKLYLDSPHADVPGFYPLA
jgi:hypothetical protein